MKLDLRPTVPELLPAFCGYRGQALRPLERGRLTDERIAECASIALERGDREGLRLARLLLRMSGDQRRLIRRSLADREGESLLTAGNSFSYT